MNSFLKNHFNALIWTKKQLVFKKRNVRETEKNFVMSKLFFFIVFVSFLQI